MKDAGMDFTEHNLQEDILARSWQFTYDRKMTYQRMKMFNYGYCHQLSEFFGVNIHSEIYRVKNQNVSVYYERQDHQKAFAKIETLLNDQTSIELIRKIRTTIEEYFKEFIEAIKDKPIRYKNISNEELLDAYNDFFELNRKISLPSWLLYLHFEEIVTRIVTKYLSAEEMAILSKPSTLTPLDSYNKELYQAALLNSEEREEALTRFAEKYASWGVSDINFDIPDRSFHEKKLIGITSEKARELLEEIEEKYKEQPKLVSEIKDTYRDNDYVTNLLSFYSLYTNFKDWKNYYRELSAYKMKFLFEEISHRTLFTLDEVDFMTEMEVEKALQGSPTVSLEDLDRRIKNSAFIFNHDQLTIVTESETLLAIDNALEMKKVSSIAGVGAFPGVVTGVVRIIFSPHDFSKINNGDILVASTTRPDYVPAMKRAAAFVTNEGGVLSHAAIMARELKIPCVIGTKIATQALKDGDMVEVNADKGTVRLL